MVSTPQMNGDEREPLGRSLMRVANWIRERIERFFPKSPFARSVSILALGTGISQGLAVLVAPILTRIYSAEDFGHFQIYASVLAFTMLAVTLRYELAIMLPEREETAASVLVLALCTLVVMTSLVGVVTWWAHGTRHLPSSAERLRPYLWLIPVGTLGAGFYQVLSSWAVRQKAYARVAGTKLTQMASQLGVQTVVGVLHGGPLGLLVGDAIGRMNGSLGLARLSWKNSKQALRSVRWQTMWDAAVRYRRFPMWANGGALIGVAASSVPALLIAQFYGARVLGWFALCDRVLGVPAMLIGQAVAQVYFSEGSRACNSDPQDLRRLFFKTAKHLALLGAVPFATLCLVSPMLFGFVFGHAWREAGVYARILALMHYVSFITWPLMPTVNIVERQFLQLCWEVGRLVLNVGSLWLAYHWGWSARAAVAVFSTTMLVSYSAHLLISHLVIGKTIHTFQLKSAELPLAQEYAKLGPL